MIASKKALAALEKRVKALELKHSSLDFKVFLLDGSVDALQDRLATAVKKGTDSLTTGTRVGYMPGNSVRWTGRVIPFPEGARRTGNNGNPLIYVLRNGTHDVRGCYAYNLVRV